MESALHADNVLSCHPVPDIACPAGRSVAVAIFVPRAWVDQSDYAKSGGSRNHVVPAGGCFRRGRAGLIFQPFALQSTKHRCNIVSARCPAALSHRQTVATGQGREKSRVEFPVAPIHAENGRARQGKGGRTDADETDIDA